jgi:hypothetical protein
MNLDQLNAQTPRDVPIDPDAAAMDMVAERVLHDRW